MMADSYVYIAADGTAQVASSPATVPAGANVVSANVGGQTYNYGGASGLGGARSNFVTQNTTDIQGMPNTTNTGQSGMGVSGFQAGQLGLGLAGLYMANEAGKAQRDQFNDQMDATNRQIDIAEDNLELAQDRLADRRAAQSAFGNAIAGR